MFSKFWEKHCNFINFTGIIATAGALFLNIPNPASEAAKSALVNIQIFLLILLIWCIVSLFISFIKLMFEKEKELSIKHDLPIRGAFSLITGFIFLWVTLNIANYIVNFDQSHSSYFIGMITISGIVMGLLYLLIVVENHKDKFNLFWGIVIWSFVMSIFICGIGGFIQEKIIGYFYTYWIYLILPISFVLICLVVIFLCILKKRKLFEVMN
jgi:hypothetical protein